MAKYNVKHTCGCEVEHNLFGKNDYREWKINKLQEEKCWKCQQVEKVEEMINSGECEVKEVSYREYKENELTAVPNTYNKETKTIKVLVKVEKVEEVKNEEEVVNEIEKEITEKAVNGKVVLNKEEVKELNSKLNDNCKKFSLDTNKVKELFNKMMERLNMVIDNINKTITLTINAIKKVINKGEVMKRAWKMFRDAKTKTSNVTFAECLRQSWAKAKSN